MADFVWPSHLVPGEVEWRLVDFTGAFANPFGGGVRTVSRGQRWACTLRFLNLDRVQRHQVMAFVAALRGRSNRVWLGDVSSPLRGSLACPELITNGYPSNDAVSPWTVSGANVTLAADGNLGLRVTWATISGTHGARHPVATFVSGARYAFRWLLTAGRGGLSEFAAIGTTAGATDVLLGTSRTVAGRYVESFAASGTSLHASVASSSAGKTAGDFSLLSGLSISRCARVAAGSAVGGTLALKDLPVSTAALARAGDLFECNGYLHRLIADVNTDASGNATALFEPTLRVSPALDTPVIFRDPMGRFLLAEEATWGTRPGLFTDISLSLIEA